MYWITEKGRDRITYIIDNMNKYWSDGRSRELDILGFLEARGGGFTPGQVIDSSASRDIERPLTGSRGDYHETFKKLTREGYVEDISR